MWEEGRGHFQPDIRKTLRVNAKNGDMNASLYRAISFFEARTGQKIIPPIPEAEGETTVKIMKHKDGSQYRVTTTAVKLPKDESHEKV